MNSSETTHVRRVALDWSSKSGKGEEIRAVLEAKLTQRKRRRVRNAGKATAALVLTALGFWVVPWYRQTSVVATAPAHTQSLALGDGSAVDLNAQTSLRTDFRYGRRIVHLDQGEAYFSVAKDVAHPFLVETSQGIVRVTGTKFNVRLAGSHEAEVTLLEGSVEITRPEESSPSVRLLPGQQFDSARAAVSSLDAAQLENVIAWRTGRLALDGLTLGDAAARFASYHGREIHVAPKAAGLHLGGSCPLDDLPAFLQFLKGTFPVTVLEQSNGSIEIGEK